jgi:hypothetical protein
MNSYEEILQAYEDLKRVYLASTKTNDPFQNEDQ